MSLEVIEDYTRVGIEDFRRRRTTWVRNICLHTRWGIEPLISLNFEAPDWRTNFSVDRHRRASAHYAVGKHVVELLNPYKFAAYHAGPVNEVSIGIEMYQTRDGKMPVGVLYRTADLVEHLCSRFSIQRQFWSGQARSPIFSGGREDPSGQAGTRFVGVFGHRNVTRRRGPGDPGNLIFHELQRRGFEPVNDLRSDMQKWSARQAAAGVPPEDQDGIPGPQTTAAFVDAGYENGVWVPSGSFVPIPSD